VARRGRDRSGLATLLQLGSPNAGTALDVLRRQRAELGDEAFFDIARGHLDEDGHRNLTAMLGDVATGADGDDSADGVPGA